MLLQQIGASVVEHEEKAPLWAEPWVFGLSIFVIMLVLLSVTWSHTNLGNRHEAIDEHSDPHRQHPNKHDHSQGH